MRNDENVGKAIEQDKTEEKKSACCVNNDGSGCVQANIGKCPVSSTLNTNIELNRIVYEHIAHFMLLAIYHKLYKSHITNLALDKFTYIIILYDCLHYQMYVQTHLRNSHSCPIDTNADDSCPIVFHCCHF